MSGDNANFKLDHQQMPLIGALFRWPEKRIGYARAGKQGNCLL
jgi:hypothetical protein